MTAYYVDTSALIKRYVDEVGSGWLRATFNVQPPPSIIVVHLIIVEVTSALTRRVREGTLTPADYAQVQNAFRADCLNEYESPTLCVLTNTSPSAIIGLCAHSRSSGLCSLCSRPYCPAVRPPT